MCIMQSSPTEETIYARHLNNKVWWIYYCTMSVIIPLLARGSPSLGSRVRLTRHSQLAIPVSPASLSKCSTPAEVEAEEVVSQLSDQVSHQVYKMTHALT